MRCNWKANMIVKIFGLFLFFTVAQGRDIEGLGNLQDHYNSTEEVKCDKSLYKKEDIQSIIDFVVDSLGINKAINDTIQTEAGLVRNKYLDRIENFRKWFVNRPQHLKHILTDISEKRVSLEKDLVEIKRSFKECPKLIKLYEEKIERANTLLKKLIHHEKLCELNCESRNGSFVLFRNAEINTTDYYCGTISEIHSTVKNQLEKFAFNYTGHVREIIGEANQEYNKTINNIFNGLKDKALEEFGRALYDVVDLQDQYHHLSNDLKEFKFDSWYLALRRLNIDIDSLLLKLENVVDIFGAYCKNCDNQSFKAVLSENRQQVEARRTKKKSSILDLLLEKKKNEINNKTEAALLNIFNDLNQYLSNGYFEKILLSIKPFHQELVKLMKKEIEAFQNLKKYSSNFDKGLIKKLMVKTQELRDAISRENDAIAMVLKKYSN